MSSVFCGKCGQQIPDDSKFCYKCGNEIPACKDINFNTPENSNRQKVDNGKTSSIKKWVIGIGILLFLPILSWTFFFNMLALTILGCSWNFAKEAFRDKCWLKMIAIIVVGFISFAVVAGIKGAIQTERKKSYRNNRYSIQLNQSPTKILFIDYYNQEGAFIV